MGRNQMLLRATVVVGYIVMICGFPTPDKNATTDWYTPTPNKNATTDWYTKEEKDPSTKTVNTTHYPDRSTRSLKPTKDLQTNAVTTTRAGCSNCGDGCSSASKSGRFTPLSIIVPFLLAVGIAGCIAGGCFISNKIKTRRESTKENGQSIPLKSNLRSKKSQPVQKGPINVGEIPISKYEIVKTVSSLRSGVVSIHGVYLDIPEGALAEEEQITLGVIWNTEYFPKLHKKTALLSPVVYCEPHGLKFKKPVSLKIPHCAHNVHSDWSITLQSSDTSVCTNPHWLTTATQDSALMTVEDYYVTVQIEHFTLYTLTGEGNDGVGIPAKVIKTLPYAASSQPGQPFKTHVYCADHYQLVNRDIENESPELHRLDTPKPIFFHNTEKNLVIELSNLSEGWNTEELYTQEVNFELVWHGLLPNTSYVFIPGSEALTQIKCTIKSYQKDFETGSQEMKINTDVRIQGIKMDSHKDAKKEEVFTPKLKRKLITQLDKFCFEGKNYKKLADSMGLNITQLEQVEQGNKSPTETLLSIWEESGKSKESFIKNMITIERHDIVAMIEEYQ